MQQRAYPELNSAYFDKQFGRQLYGRGPADAMNCLNEYVLSVRKICAAAASGVPIEDSDFSNPVVRRDELGLATRPVPPLYFWRSDPAELVCAGADSYPLNVNEPAVVLGSGQARAHAPTYLPHVPMAFCVFERPLQQLAVRINGEDITPSALMWKIVLSAKTKEIWLSFRFLVWRPGFVAAVFWSDGIPSNNDTVMEGTASAENDEFTAEKLKIIRWICAASMFVEQKVVDTSRPNIDKRTVDDAANRLGVMPTYSVITMRVRERPAGEHGDGQSDVEWTRRWLVRGHWRKQWFPSRGTNAPIWIHPHVKGPEDKPLVIPDGTVFSVVR